MMELAPPDDWSDRKGWDQYLSDRLSSDEQNPMPTSHSLRFAEFALSRGGNVWFPGCGIDLTPIALAFAGCDVVVSDISMVAIERQRALATASPEDLFEDWAETSNAVPRTSGKLTALHHDFVTEPLTRVFDVVINSRAFHGLRDAQKQSAAANFKASLRAGGL